MYIGQICKYRIRVKILEKLYFKAQISYVVQHRNLGYTDPSKPSSRPPQAPGPAKMIITEPQLAGEASKQGRALKPMLTAFTKICIATRLCTTQERPMQNQGHAGTAHLTQEAKRQQADPKADCRFLILVPAHPCVG